MTSSCQRTLFCKIMDRASCVQTYGYLPIESNVCVSGHDLNKFVVERFFNRAAKKLGRGDDHHGSRKCIE